MEQRIADRFKRSGKLVFVKASKSKSVCDAEGPSSSNSRQECAPPARLPEVDVNSNKIVAEQVVVVQEGASIPRIPVHAMSQFLQRFLMTHSSIMLRVVDVERLLKIHFSYPWPEEDDHTGKYKLINDLIRCSHGVIKKKQLNDTVFIALSQEDNSDSDSSYPSSNISSPSSYER